MLLRLEAALLEQLQHRWIVGIYHSDLILLSLDVLDVPQQCVPLHVGVSAHHVSALPGQNTHHFLCEREIL